MDVDFAKKLDHYAEVIVKVGLNIQPGQRLLIGMPFYKVLGTQLELAPLVRRITAKAYQAGAKLVDVMWNDEELELIRLKHAPRDSFAEFPSWRTDGAMDIAQAGDAILILAAITPELLIDQDPNLVNQSFMSVLEHMKPITKKSINNEFTMVLAAAPLQGWNDKVFEDIPREQRERFSWDTIFDFCRINEADPISAWKKHMGQLESRGKKLTEKHYIGLRLKAPGTELVIGLPNQHIWKAAIGTHQKGFDFVGCMPTEEVFTAPHKDQTEGTVKTSKPLNYGGVIIEDITLEFSKGKIINASARTGEETLHAILKTDEGALRLGEVALVPHNSPISQTGRNFYSILIDENASNHIALGRAYRETVIGGQEMSDDEFALIGGNNSLLHLDLMIGSGEMDVDGILPDGISEPVMRAGEWEFDV